MLYLKIYPEVKGQSKGEKRPCFLKHRVILKRAGYVCTGRGRDQFGHYLIAEEPESQNGMPDLCKRGFDMVSSMKEGPSCSKRYGNLSRQFVSLF
jgi:hypothetical protein